MAEMLIQSESLTHIADQIRVLKGTTESMSLDDMATELDTIPKNDSSNLTASGATITVPSGYYATQATKSVATATQATPSVSIDSAGKITATATQTAGYVSAGTKTGTKQLTTQAAKTVTPSTSSQTVVASGVYTTGAVTVSGDANLVADNIKSGVSIFGVEGSYEGSGGASVETGTVRVSLMDMMYDVIYGTVYTTIVDSTGVVHISSSRVSDILGGNIHNVVIGSIIYLVMDSSIGSIMLRGEGELLYSSSDKKYFIIKFDGVDETIDEFVICPSDM